MAYTRAWTTTTPADTDQASTIGLAIRNLRTDLQERMNTLLNGGWTTDPVAGFPLTKVIYLPPSLGISSDGPSTVSWFYFAGAPGGASAMAVRPLSSTENLYIPLIIPVGATLTKVRAAVFRKTGAGGGLITAQVWQSTQVSSPNAALLGSVTSTPTANSTWVYVDCAVPSHLVAAAENFMLFVQGFSAAQGDVLYGGAEVTYTVPDLLTSR